MNTEDIFDYTEENKPHKPPMSAKTKKKLLYLLCAVIGIAVAAVLILIFNVIFQGASSPEAAVAEYERAAIIYDIDNMIEYSSQYNKVVLYGNRETSDRLLYPYLKKAYADRTSQYSPEEIKFELISVLEYEEGSKKFEEICEKYDKKVENGSDEIEKAAIVRMTIVKGTNRTTRNYVVVKVGMRWFFAYANA